MIKDVLVTNLLQIISKLDVKDNDGFVLVHVLHEGDGTYLFGLNTSARELAQATEHCIRSLAGQIDADTMIKFVATVCADMDTTPDEAPQ